MAWNCRAGWLPEIEEFLSFLSQLMTMPTRERRPCRQARSLSSGSRSATRFFCKLFKRLCSWPVINHKEGTMVRAHRLSTSMGYIAAIFHKANEYPRVEPLSFGCACSRSVPSIRQKRSSAPSPAAGHSRLRAAALASSISRPPSYGDLHYSEDPSAADLLPPRNAAPEADQHSRDSMA